jgi:hypothetical protein
MPLELGKRTQADDQEPPSHVWGSRGRRFKSCQPDGGKPQFRGRVRRDPERPLTASRSGLTTIRSLPVELPDLDHGPVAGRRVTWRRFIPAGALATACATTYGAFSTVYMPRRLASYSERYGLIGVTLALIGWLLGIAHIIVAASSRSRFWPFRSSRCSSPGRSVAILLRSTASGTSPQR